MPNVRITKCEQDSEAFEWIGAPTLDRTGHLDQSLGLPETVRASIERAIALGHLEGDCFVDPSRRFHWFLDR